jgi:hypothetical protein
MHNILIGLIVLLGLVLAYVGVYLAVDRLADEHRKRVTVVLCFACSAVALLVAIYIASRNQ